MQLARWGAALLFVLAVPLFLVLSNVRIAASEPRVFAYSFSAYDVPAVSGIERPQLDRAAREIVAYFRNDEELLTSRVTIDGSEQALFNNRELLHMRDVKRLFLWTFRLQELAAAYIVIYVAAVFIWSREQSLRRLARLALVAGAATAGLLAVAALAVTLGFDTLCEQFHLLSFSNDFWQLNPERDRLVQMFPQGFWFDVTLGVGLLSALEGALLAGLGYAYLWWQGRREHGLSFAKSALPALLAAGLSCVAVFWLLNPILWSDPIGRLGEVLAFWRKHMAFQQGRWAEMGGAVAHDLGGRLALLRDRFLGQEEPLRALVGAPGGALLLALGLTALAARALGVRILGAASGRGRALALLTLLWCLAAGVGTALWLPLDWDRYYLPLLAGAALLEGALVGLLLGRLQGLFAARSA